MTPEELDELDRLETAATPGPWTMDQAAAGFSGFRADGAAVFFTAAPNGCPRPEEDHALVVELRNAAPALIEAARERNRLKAAAAAERERCAKLADDIANRHWDLYKGRNADLETNDKRADPWEQGVSDGAYEVAEAIRGGKDVR